MPDLQTKPLVFLSYAREDQEQVADLYRKLEAVGLRPWMDVEDIAPGSLWERDIMSNIRRAAFFLACLSQHSVRKAGMESVIRAEIAEALDVWKQKGPDEIFLIPVRLMDCNLPDMLAKFQWVDLFTERGLRLLLDTLVTRSQYKGLAVTALEPRAEGLAESKPAFDVQTLNRYLERLADFQRPRLVIEGINTDNLSTHLDPPFGGRDYLGTWTIPEGERCLYLLELNWWQGTNGSEDVTDQIVDVLAFRKADFLRAVEAQGEVVRVVSERIRHDLFWEDISSTDRFNHIPDVPLKLQVNLNDGTFKLEHTSQVKSIDHPYRYHVDWVQDIFNPPG